MTYLRYTYVDAQTGVPCTQAPMRHGPMFPAIPGLLFGFALESQYPTATPTFYGTAPDGTHLAVPGVLDVLTAGEYHAAEQAELALRRTAAQAERQAARLAAETGGYRYAGHPVDADRDSILRISNASITALTSLALGLPFATAWTCADDAQIPLDASGVLALQAALSTHGQACHDRSTALKAMIDGATDLAALAAVAAEIGSGWPSVDAP
jgi:hypothetical protein